MCLFVAFLGTSRSLLYTSLFLHICTNSASVHLKTHLYPSIGPSCLAAWLDPLLLWLSALVTVSDSIYADNWSMCGRAGNWTSIFLSCYRLDRFSTKSFVCLVQWSRRGYSHSKKELMRKPTMEWWTVSGKLDTHSSNIMPFRHQGSHEWQMSQANPALSPLLQKDPEKGGSRSVPQGGQLPGPGYCPTLWHCPGCVLCRSWRVPAGVHPLQHLLCINKLFPSLSATSIKLQAAMPWA